MYKTADCSMSNCKFPLTISVELLLHGYRVAGSTTSKLHKTKVIRIQL